MKQEVRRGRKFVEYHDPETQPEGTFTQEISGADVSYQDESGNWLAADENWATDGADGFILKNDKLNHKIRLKGAGGRTWYPRRNVNTEYMTFGVPQYRNGLGEQNRNNILCIMFNETQCYSPYWRRIYTICRFAKCHRSLPPRPDRHLHRRRDWRTPQNKHERSNEQPYWRHAWLNLQSRKHQRT